MWVVIVSGQERDALTELRREPQTRARRRQYAARKRIGQAGDEGQAVVIAPHNRRGLRETKLSHSVNDQRNSVSAPAATQHCLVGQLVSKTDARLYIVFVGVPETAMILVGEDQAAFGLEAAHRDCGDRAGRVGRLRSRFDWAGDGLVETEDVAVIA